MLDLFGPARAYCDGLSRRSLLRIGGLALGGSAGGLSLASLLRAEEAVRAAGGTDAPKKLGHKAVIMVYLSGGLAHQDSFDLKPQAPDEVRGEFKPIATNVAGIDVCEHLPKLAGIMDKLAVVRAVVGQRDEHSSFQNLTGYGMGKAQREGRPSLGSVVSRVQGAVSEVVPAFVDLFPVMQHRPYNSPGPGALGHAYAGVTAHGEDMASMKLRFVSPEHLGDRAALRFAFDNFRRDADSLDVGRMDNARQRALEVLTSSTLVDALDLDKEDPAVRERYGKTSSQHQGDGAPLWNDHLLMARRLVECGVRCVTAAYGFWDTHGNNFGHLRGNLPQFDAGIAALVQDLHERGLADDVTVAVWGEFGRTPKINKDAGRDHWAPVNCTLLAGGGLKTGQVVGATDKLAGYALDRPVHFHDVIATLYHNLGIDPHLFVRDFAERPMPLLPGSSTPIRELV